MRENPVRVAIAMRHSLLRWGVRCALENAGFDIVIEAEEPISFVLSLDRFDPSVALADEYVFSAQGVRQALIQIHDVPAVIIGERAVVDGACEALAAGATSFVPPDASASDLVATAAAAAKRQVVLTPAVQAAVVDRIRHPAPAN